MSAHNLGANFEREIREQPDVWDRIARSDKARTLAEAIDDNVVLVGSGSSYFLAELGALALRRRHLQAHALAATEARLDHGAYDKRTTIAISQSGRSTDVLEAMDILRPSRLIALTNDPQSPLATRAHVPIDVGAGREVAVPASKSVSATASLLLWAASLVEARSSRGEESLLQSAQTVRAWLASDEIGTVAQASSRIAACTSVVFLGSDYGLPIAREAALKLKEAAYLHTEGLPAGEFRHGSIAMVDRSTAIVGIADEDGMVALERPLHDVERSGATRYTIGMSWDGVQRLGPQLDIAFNTLGWLVTAQLIALDASRARGIDADRPRGLTKALVDE
ncbi:MAG: SIS domain-containing protein [Candidatus Eremiobacteraeota bacterium]|nr:SIS domain-containing protein [Candidatus Eremiobacteraeota bacterium]